MLLQSCSYPTCTILQFLNKELDVLPNQELSVLYGGPTLNYGKQLSLYFPHMLRVNMTRDLTHLQLSDLQGEIRPICRTSALQRERESLYAERSGYYPDCNNVKKIVLRASICLFSSYFLFVDASLAIFAQISTSQALQCRIVGWLAAPLIK